MAAKYPWTKRAEGNGLLFEKELLPTGEITRWIGDDKEVKRVNITRPFLERIVRQFQRFAKVGVRVPLFKTHIEDPDNDRGTVEELLIKTNDKGHESLFGLIRFADKDAAKKGTQVDVSVMCPPKFVDGKNNKYYFPLRHVALTSKPVVPGLERFEPVVLSFDTPSGLMLAEEVDDQEGEWTMDEVKWAKLLELLGITPEEGSTPDEQLDAILAAVEELVGAGDEEEAPAGGAGGGKGGDAAMGLSFPPMMVRQMTRAREDMVQTMVDKRELSPTMGKEFKAKYCSKEAVLSDLQLSADEDGDGECEFDRAVDLAKKLSKDRPLEATGRRTIKMGSPSTDQGEESDNPLLRDAARRAKKKSAKRA